MTYTTLVSALTRYVEREDDSAFEDQVPTFVLFAQKRIARELKILGLQQYNTSTFTANNGVVQKPSRWLKTISMNWGSSNGEATGATVTAGGSGYVAPVTVTSTGGGFTTQPTWSATVLNGVITQIVPLTPGVGGTSAPTITITGFGSSGSSATATATVSTSNIKRNILEPRSYEFCRLYCPNENTTGTPKFYADYDWNNWLVVPTPATAFPIQAAYYELANPIDAVTTTNWLTENAPDLLLYATICEAAPFVRMSEANVKMWEAKYERAGLTYKGEDKSRETDRSVKRSD